MSTILRPDADPDDADWIKWQWDFPPYKSVEFFDSIGHDPQQLVDFRASPAYKAAVDRGLIHDDEWVLEWCEPDTDPPTHGDDDDGHGPHDHDRKRKVHVHVHRSR